MDDRNVAKEIREAIRGGNLEQVERLLAEDPSRLDMTTPFGTWLHVAASFGKLDIVKYLVERGVDVNACGGIEGSSPLHVAAGEGHLGVVHYLVAHGAALDVSEAHRNPLFAAIYGGHLETALALVDAGIDAAVKYTGASTKNTDAVAFARQYGRQAIEDHAEIMNHMARYYGRVQRLSLQETLPVTGISVHVIPPRSDDGELILFTTGMSDRKQAVPKGQEELQYTELMLRLPSDWPLERLEDPASFWPIEWLKKMAWYPRDNETWLGGPFSIISNGEPPEPLGAKTFVLDVNAASSP